MDQWVPDQRTGEELLPPMTLPGSARSQSLQFSGSAEGDWNSLPFGSHSHPLTLSRPPL